MAGAGVPGAGASGCAAGGAVGGGEFGTWVPGSVTSPPAGLSLPWTGAVSVGRSVTTSASKPSLLLEVWVASAIGGALVSGAPSVAGSVVAGSTGGVAAGSVTGTSGTTSATTVSVLTSVALYLGFRRRDWL